MTETLAQLQRFRQGQEGLQDLHPLLRQTYPIALTLHDTFAIYAAEGEGPYRLVGRAPAAAPIPPDLCEALPLPANGGRPTIVADPALLGHHQGWARILHAGAHCFQQQGPDQAAAALLGIEDPAALAEVELLYTALDFQWLYATLLDQLAAQATLERVAALRRALRELLSAPAWQALIWSEWREGFARYLEELIRARLGLAANLAGAPPDWRPATLGYGGARLIAWLANDDTTLPAQLTLLAARIQGLGSAPSTG